MVQWLKNILHDRVIYKYTVWSSTLQIYCMGQCFMNILHSPILFKNIMHGPVSYKYIAWTNVLQVYYASVRNRVVYKCTVWSSVLQISRIVNCFTNILRGPVFYKYIAWSSVLWIYCIVKCFTNTLHGHVVLVRCMFPFPYRMCASVGSCPFEDPIL